jgi:hypothetical protein
MAVKGDNGEIIFMDYNMAITKKYILANLENYLNKIKGKKFIKLYLVVVILLEGYTILF